MTSRARLTIVAGSVALVAASTGPAGAFLPYRIMLEAARSPEKPLAFIQDKALRLGLREAVGVADPDAALSVTPYVVGGHGYLVGWVKDDAEREKVEGAARSVTGLGSLTSYLPTEPTGADAPSREAELALKAKVEKAITLASKAHRMNVSVEVLGSHVVLVGAVSSGAAVQSADAAARGTPGVTGVTSFLSVPEPGSKKLVGDLLP